MNFFFSHSPRFIDASAAGIGRASDSIRAMASSATLTLLAPAAFMTRIPRAVAAGTSTLSTPVPARAITRSFGAASIRLRGDLRGAAHDEGVGLGEIACQLGGFPAGLGVDGPSGRAQSVGGGGGEGNRQ
jgi:hypothetical protein